MSKKSHVERRMTSRKKAGGQLVPAEKKALPNIVDRLGAGGLRGGGGGGGTL